jgi:hypothetical protein
MNTFEKVMKCSTIELTYLPATDIAMADIKAHSRDAVAAMLGTLIQSAVKQKYLTADEILTIYCKAVLPERTK